MSLFKSILAKVIYTTDQSIEQNDAVIMVLTIHQCFLNFILRGHHEGTVLHDLLFEGLSSDLRVVSCISTRNSSELCE